MAYYFMPGMLLKTSATGAMRYEIILHNSLTEVSYCDNDFVL